MIDNLCKNIIYSKDNCPWCDKAKTLLKEENLNFIEIKVNSDISREDFANIMKDYKLEKLTVPQIFIDGTYIGGFENLKNKFN